MGLSVGATYGFAEGYPNDLNYIGNPVYRSHVVGLGRQFDLWLGGAFTDWFTFGVGIGTTKVSGKVLDANTSALLFRVHVFPLIEQGGIFRDLGLCAKFGTGSGAMARTGDGSHLLVTGSTSFAAFGAFWEALRTSGGHWVAGPYLDWQYQSSNSFSSSLMSIGMRGTFYGANTR
jgi:hypothetical protein